jgi:thiamine-monophosphate kinase
VVLDLDGTALDHDVRAVAQALGVTDEIARSVVLTAGEDHGLLACFPDGAALPAPFRIVGAVVAGTPAVLVDGVPPAETAGGWDSFAPRRD